MVTTKQILRLYKLGCIHKIHLKLFVRYVDDTLAVFDNKDNALLFLKYLNSFHPSIKFTMECEEDDKLAFLDLLIIKSKGNVELTVYRKPTHSGVFTHFNSFIPHRYKVSASENPDMQSL